MSVSTLFTNNSYDLYANSLTLAGSLDINELTANTINATTINGANETLSGTLGANIITSTTTLNANSVATNSISTTNINNTGTITTNIINAQEGNIPECTFTNLFSNNVYTNSLSTSTIVFSTSQVAHATPFVGSAIGTADIHAYKVNSDLAILLISQFSADNGLTIGDIHTSTSILTADFIPTNDITLIINVTLNNQSVVGRVLIYNTGSISISAYTAFQPGQINGWTPICVLYPLK